MILADTDVLIDYLAGLQPVQHQIMAYASVGNLQTSAITAFELLSGAGAGKRGDKIRRLIATLPVLSLDQAGAERAAEVRQQLEREGQSIGMGDSLIAGIALANKCQLFTRNQKHFRRVAQLLLVDS